MIPRTTLRQALSDAALLGNVLVGPSWDTWRPVLLATCGERLTPKELRTFSEVTGRATSPTSLVEEAAFVIGRRGGKDRAASVLASYFAALCEHPALAPGERGVVLCIGADQRQAKVTRDYIEGALRSSPILSQLVVNATQDSVELERISIEVRAASFRRNRGVTAVAVIATECAFWPSDESANPDTEILTALRPALATTGGPLILISSPYARRGELWEIYRRHYGPTGDPAILVVHGASRTFNPTLFASVVQRALERDPASASAEYLAQFRTDIESFIAREAIEACIAPGLRERAPLPGIRYVAFCDPSGGSADSFTLAVSHMEKNGIAALDAIRETRPPFSPERVVEEFSALLKSYHITGVRGDRYAGEWPREQFQKRGIKYTPSDKTKSDIYRDLLPLVNSGKVELLDHVRLTTQLCSLERRTARGGRDSIDHAPGAHDDIANAAAGALCSAASIRGTMQISDRVLAKAAQPAALVDRHSPSAPVFFR